MTDLNQQPDPRHAQVTAQRAQSILNLSKSTQAKESYVETHDYIYVVGGIDAHFPNLSIEKEFYQACLLTNVDVSSLKDVNDDVALARLNQNPSLNALMYQGLGQKSNKYVARDMNWVFCNVDGNEVYNLITDSDESLMQFVAALGLKNQHVIMLGQMMPDGRVLVSNLIPAESTPVDQSHIVHNETLKMKELVEEIRSLNANDGIKNEDRALNYVLYNNKEVFNQSYNLCYKANPSGPNPNGYQLINVEVVTSWSGERLVSKVIFNYQGINTSAKQSWCTTVDVTGEYPFILTNWKRFLPQY